MRTAPNDLIWNLWGAGGPFIGDNGASHGRVTVEIGWLLRKSATSTVGGNQKGPFRWFQRSDNSQVETEIPNIMSIDINRTIDTDAATCTIVMLNTSMDQNSETPLIGTLGESVGKPGFFWPGRGDSAVGTTLWGQTANMWNSVLQPNALIRTYQGYGGRTKTLDQALNDGNIIQTGLWLVDKVDMDAQSGKLTLTCRDMAKLLIDQMIYPPLVPRRNVQVPNTSNPNLAYYPLYYFRWIYTNHPVIPYGNTVYHTGFVSNEVVLPQPPSYPGVSASSHYDDGSSPANYGGFNSVDGDDVDTYWLSGGRVNEGEEWIEYSISGTNTLVGGVNIIPYGGNYVCYVSVSSNGVWNDPNGTSTPPASSIPYVIKQGIGWERASTIDVTDPNGNPWTHVDRVRLTFTHLAKLGPNPPLRCGVRDFRVGTFTNTVSGNGRVVCGIGRGSNDPNVTNGYWVVGSDGHVFSFGGLKFFGSAKKKQLNTTNDGPFGPVTGIATDSLNGKGYRLCAKDGGVFDFGDLYYHGSIPGGTYHAGHGPLAGNDWVESIENGDGGHSGYYLLRATGLVDEYGSATWHGDDTQIPGGQFSTLYYVSSMAVKQSVPRGYWTITTKHEIQAHGGASILSQSGGPGAWVLADDGLATAIVSTPSGNGYWTVTALGRVRSYGDAVDFGGLPSIGVIIQIGVQKGITDMVCTASGNGYWLVGQDGGVFAFGDAQFSGSLPQQYFNIGDGNYQDYTDIVKDLLLWCGWWFRNPANPGATPQVFGNVESTGIYAPDNLTEDFFDKKAPIDIINNLKEIVGYINLADEIGAYQFKSPNVWSIGNFLDTGVPTSRMAVIDEKHQITQYGVDFNDTDARSTIIVATEDPALNIAGTKSVTINSQWADDVLRGIVRPALWVNGKFLTTAIQTTMANLIDLHLFMQSRQGSLNMPANPIIQIDDQVQIYERSTAEVYIHYVRGYTTHMDFETGEYTQVLQTHWLGDGNAWHLSYNPAQNAVQLADTNTVDSAPVFINATPPNGST